MCIRDRRKSTQVAKLVNELSVKDRDELLQQLSIDDPALADLIREALFTFNDLKYLEGKSLQVLLKDTDPQVLLKALKGATLDVKQAIFAQLSRRKVQMIEEELIMMPLLRRSEVQEAQRQIARRARELEKRGEIIIIRPGDDEQYV